MEVLPITVIMPSYLSNYAGSAMNRENKFRRAVNSFLVQDYERKLLIIVSDGCEITEEIYSKELIEFSNIMLIPLEKQPLFSGNVRQAALHGLSTSVITYLDTDDMYREKNHLSKIAEQIQDADWIYYDEYIGNGKTTDGVKHVELKQGSIGTSSIAHRIIDSVSWSGCDGYGHDWLFIQRLMAASKNYKKASGMSYAICHIPNKIEC